MPTSFEPQPQRGDIDRFYVAPGELGSLRDDDLWRAPSRKDVASQAEAKALRLAQLLLLASVCMIDRLLKQGLQLSQMFSGGGVDDDGPSLPCGFDPSHAEPVPLEPAPDGGG